MENYSVYSKFNLAKHKETYPYYTEVIILPDGTIEYAVPSHQEKLISILMQDHRASRSEILDMCPREMHSDFIQWLCNCTRAVCVWYEGVLTPDNSCTNSQISVLRNLKLNGCYAGGIPNVRNTVSNI